MKFGIQDVQAWFYNMLHGLFGKFKNFGFCEKLSQNLSSFDFWGKNSFSGKSEMTVLKTPYFTSFVAFYLPCA